MSDAVSPVATVHHHSKLHISFKAVKAVIPFRHRRARKNRAEADLTEDEKRAALVAIVADEDNSTPRASSSATPSDRSILEQETETSSDDESDEADEQEQEREIPDDESFHLPSPTRTPEIAASVPAFFATQTPSDDKAEIAAFIAEHGSSSSTSWLEFSRYKIWRPSHPIAGSSFVPVQGYLRADPWVFAWGNPLVSDKSALGDTAAAFWAWAQSEKLKLVWCCVDDDLEAVLGKDPRFKWAALSCIVEDMLDPAAVVELAHSAANGSSEVKDFKKNLRRAERESVQTREVREDEWTADMRREVEEGIIAWKKAKSKTGLQLASTSFQPWLDGIHRRYFVAEHADHVVGILILSQINGDQYQIKNQAMFPGAPRGTSEWLIYNAMGILAAEEQGTTWVPLGGAETSAAAPETTPAGRAYVTFGITASEHITPTDNLSGWKIKWLSSTYNKVVGSTGLTRRGDFRSKFHTVHLPMYVCYPAKQGFGLDGVSKLIKSLRQ